MTDREILALEEIGARTWPARDTGWLGGWLVSIDQGLTRRANSVLPLGWDDSAALDDRIAEVERRYRQHGLPPCFKMTRAARPDGLGDVLERRGYRAEGHSLVLTASAHPPAGPADAAVDLSAELSPAWLDCMWPDRSGDQRWIGIIDRVPGPRAFALARVDGRAAGGALATVMRGWGCITAVHTRAAVRRRGVGRALIAALSAWARQRAPTLFLQVEADNDPALRLYASAGFSTAYRYHYRTLTR